MKTIEILLWCEGMADKSWRKQVNAILLIVVLLMLAVGTIWFLARYIDVYVPIGYLSTKFISALGRL